MAKSLKKQKEERQANQSPESPQETISRIRLPKAPQLLGLVEQRLGGNKMHVVCSDGKTRNCRVPGRLKRALWLRPGDVIIVEPWELDNAKADVLFKYKKSQAEYLKKQDHFETDTTEF